MESAIERGPDWAGLPVIATVARLLCRELTPCCPETHLGFQDALLQPHAWYSRRSVRPPCWEGGADRRWDASDSPVGLSVSRAHSTRWDLWAVPPSGFGWQRSRTAQTTPPGAAADFTGG
jgi:hypothetical protein